MRTTIMTPSAHAINLITNGDPPARKDLKELAGVGFKTIIAKDIWRSALIDDDVIRALEAYIPLAPTHNPAYIASIRSFQKLLPNTPLVAVFETWFHQTIPDYAYEFGVPRTWVKKHKIRRYGFHGASHRYVSERVPELLEGPVNPRLRLVSCHLGGSSSLCAIRGGKSIDTTLGSSTQYGVLQSTRSGDLDPFAVLYVMDEERQTTNEIRRQLVQESGLLGISGVSGDLRDLEAAANMLETTLLNSQWTPISTASRSISVPISPRLEASMSSHSPAALAKKALPLGRLSVKGWNGSVSDSIRTEMNVIAAKAKSRRPTVAQRFLLFRQTKRLSLPEKPQM